MMTKKKQKSVLLTQSADQGLTVKGAMDEDHGCSRCKTKAFGKSKFHVRIHGRLHPQYYLESCKLCTARMHSTIQPIDMTVDTSSFDLPRCTPLSPKAFVVREDEQALPEPQPFVRSKKSSEVVPPINMKFSRLCKAATGKDIHANEPGKWTTGIDSCQKSASLRALYFLQTGSDDFFARHKSQ